MYTAHDKQQFKALLSEVRADLMNVLHHESKASDALYIFLMRLRTGRTYNEIGMHFGVSETTVTRRCDLVRDILKRVVVPRYVNFGMDRAELVSNKSQTSHILFDDENLERAHLILDGTYIYVQKSTNQRFQKDSYNSHKKRNYIKIMMGVQTNGRILFVLGPFKATDNDAKITECIFTNQSVSSISTLMPEDIMIVDRGFRNCETMLINLGFHVKKPASNDKGKLSTKEANETRMVTRVRYNVERINGVMKIVWKIFSNVIDVYCIPKIMVEFEIGAALINRKANFVQDTERSILMAQCMKIREKVSNVLSTIVEKKSFERLIRDESYDIFTDFQDCPRLSIGDLEMVSLGVYQVQQARCYLANHLDSHGNGLNIFRFFDEDVKYFCSSLINPDMHPLLLMADLKSRFASKTVHRTFVLLDQSGIGHNCVIAHSCSCKSGNRTVGCCSHIMSILYFISQDDIKEVSKHLNNVFVWDTNEEESEGSEFEDY